MRVLITGADGFIGKYLVNFFAKENHKVIALLRSRNPAVFSDLARCQNVNIIEFDLEFIEDLESIFLNKIDIIYHLAWAGVDSSFKDDLFMQLKNINYTAKLLQLSKKHNVRKFIFPGSISEFALDGNEIDGMQLPNPSNLYGAVKYSTRLISDTYCKNHNLKFISVLISSVYGPGRNGDNLISYSIKKMINDISPNYTKLEQKWDYIYIEDLIEVLYLIGTRGKRTIYTVGSGMNYSLRDIVYRIRDLINPKLTLNIGVLKYKNSSLENSIVDTSSLKEDFNFRPKFSLDVGLLKTIEFYRRLT